MFKEFYKFTNVSSQQLYNVHFKHGETKAQRGYFAQITQIKSGRMEITRQQGSFPFHVILLMEKSESYRTKVA